mgnify:CR=1 FL=1
MYNIRLLEESDYETMADWWKFWRFPVPPRDFLPQDGLGGLMLLLDNVPVAAGFLYITNSKVAWLEFVVTNPSVKNKELREEIKTIIVRELTVSAHELGKKYVFTTLKNQGLVKNFEECGYTKGSSNCLEMVAVL